MRNRFARAGALALALAVLGLVVAHAGASGCGRPEDAVTTPTAERTAPPTPTKAPPDPSGQAVEAAERPAPSALPSAGGVTIKPASRPPRFMGASKAAPVFQEGDVFEGQNPPPANQAAGAPRR